MPIIFILMLCLYLGGNVYVFVKGLHFLNGLPVYTTIIYSIFFWICAFGLIGVFLLRNALLPAGIGKSIQYIGTGWLVFMLYFTGFLLLTDIFRLFKIMIPYAFPISLGLTVILLAYGFYQYKHPKTNVINIDINKSLTGYQQLKIVGISDIHLGYATNKQNLKNYVEMINHEKPDLIIIGGDLIDNSTTPVVYQQMEIELKKLTAPLGIYMVPGNHEYISDINKSIEFIKKTPIKLLKDTTIKLSNGLQIVGRDDRANPHRKDLAELTKDLDPSFPSILLDHQPYNLEETVEAGIDLQFSGHTHRGQIFPLNLLTDKLFEVSHGYKIKENSHIFVSTGLSLWGPPFRIGTSSEMVVFNITFKP